MAGPPLTEHYTRHYLWGGVTGGKTLRTKLDELVEEAYEVSYNSDLLPESKLRPCLNLIAERAFRYGAERHALWVKSVVDASPNIVPVPVEEKRAPSACDCGWCEGTSEAPCEVARLGPKVREWRK